MVPSLLSFLAIFTESIIHTLHQSKHTSRTCHALWCLKVEPLKSFLNTELCIVPGAEPISLTFMTSIAWKCFKT